MGLFRPTRCFWLSAPPAPPHVMPAPFIQACPPLHPAVLSLCPPSILSKQRGMSYPRTAWHRKKSLFRITECHDELDEKQRDGLSWLFPSQFLWKRYWTLDSFVSDIRQLSGGWQREKEERNEQMLSFFVKYLIRVPKLINLGIQSATIMDDPPNERPNIGKTERLFGPSHAYSKGGWEINSL